MSGEIAEAADQIFELAASSRFRECVCRHAGLSPTLTPNLKFHPHDQMLLHSLKAFDASTALSQYFSVAIQQYRAFRQVLAALGVHGHSCRLLDFACGFGRLLRFATLQKPASEIWASEIQTEALDFVRSEFGVNAIRSGPDAADFDPGIDFHLIWVASLFSHLPEKRFHAWLSRLMSALAPDAILAFSVHDSALLRPAVPGDFVYLENSENADLDTSIYGTTFVTEPFVARAITASHPGYRYLRIARGLANEQDLYLVSRRDLSALRNFRRGPWGFVDITRVSADRELFLTGWAAALDDASPPRVRVAIDGVAHDCPVQGVRPDVGEALGDARFNRSGWQFVGRLPPGRTFIEVSAESLAEERALLHAGFV